MKTPPLWISIPAEKPLSFFGGRTASQVARDSERENRERQRERRQVVPSAARSGIVASWYCMPAVRYCGAPPGWRCPCGRGFEDHDPGDEQ